MCPSAHHPLAIAVPGEAPLHDQLWMPFRSGRHAATDAIVPAHFDWLDHHGLRDARSAPTFARARFHELAGLVYHDEDAETLRLAADFIATLFVFDDLMDTDGDPARRDPRAAQVAADTVRRAARSGRAPRGSLTGVTAVASGMADLTLRLARRGGCLDGYLGEVDVYLEGVVEETRRRAAGFTSVSDYAAVRVAFSAVYACVELALAARGTSLDPELRPLARLANLSVSWVNDVWSWPKERALGERSNLVAVLMDTEGRSERDAFHQACRRCDDVVTDYLDAREHHRAAPALGLLEAWMRGNLDWHAVGTARYRAHLSVAPMAA
jgi:hypothetical protein